MSRHAMPELMPMILRGLVIMPLVAALAEPVSAQQAGVQNLSSAGVTHEVMRGESLWSIARRHYGNPKQWPVLFRANRALIGANPSLILPGMQLEIPPSQTAHARLAPVAASIPEPKLPELAEAEPETLPPTLAESPLPPAEVAPDPVIALPVQARESRERSGIDYLPVATSLLVPGSGQAIQGNWEKGLTHLGIMTMSLLAFKAASEHGDRPLQVIGGLGLVGITLWSPWDAFQAVRDVEPSEPSGLHIE